MTEEKSKISIGQKVLIMVGIVSSCALAFPFLSLILLGILAKLMPKSGFITTLTMVIPFLWGPFLGIIFGLILGIIVTYRIEKTANKYSD